MKTGRACWVVGVFVVLLRCASVAAPELPPSDNHHIRACVAICQRSRHLVNEFGEDDGGWVMREQRTCRAPGVLQFEDGYIFGELPGRWKWCREWDTSDVTEIRCTLGTEYDKRDVRRGSCSVWTGERCRALSSAQRGQYPGEGGCGDPLPTQ